jgi:hypothetical protein
LCGYVLLDLTDMAFKTADYFIVNSIDAAPALLQEEIKKWIVPQYKSVFKHLDRNRVKSIQVHMDAVFESPQGWGSHSSFLHCFLVLPDDPWHAVFMEVTARLGANRINGPLPGPTYLASPRGLNWLSGLPGRQGLVLEDLAPGKEILSRSSLDAGLI